MYKKVNKNEGKYRQKAQQSKDSNSDEEFSNNIINFFISNTMKNDINTWAELIQIFDQNDQDIQFDYNVSEKLICNSVKVFNESAQSIQNYVLQFIYRILQHSDYIKKLFEIFQMNIILCSIISESTSDSMKYQAFMILDTYLNSFDEYENVVIQWANDFLKKLNPLIIDYIEKKETSLSTLLSISTFLLEKGVFTVEDMNLHFCFYSNLLVKLNQLDLYYGIHNFEIILNRFPCFYTNLEQSHQSTINFLNFTLSLKNPNIVKSSLNIFNAMVPHDLDYFLSNLFIQKCSDLMQNNNNKELALAITNFLLSICSISYQACDEVIKTGFFKCNEMFHYGFTVEIKLLQIVKEVVEKVNITYDAFTVHYILSLLNSCIVSDDISCIITVLDIIIALLPSNFQFNQELINIVYNFSLGNPENSNEEISHKATVIKTYLDKLHNDDVE